MPLLGRNVIKIVICSFQLSNICIEKRMLNLLKITTRVLVYLIDIDHVLAYSRTQSVDIAFLSEVTLLAR
jgi:hypothetical protein